MPSQFFTYSGEEDVVRDSGSGSSDSDSCSTLSSDSDGGIIIDDSDSQNNSTAKKPKFEESTALKGRKHRQNSDSENSTAKKPKLEESTALKDRKHRRDSDSENNSRHKRPKFELPMRPKGNGLMPDEITRIRDTELRAIEAKSRTTKPVMSSFHTLQSKNSTETPVEPLKAGFELPKAREYRTTQEIAMGVPKHFYAQSGVTVQKSEHLLQDLQKIQQILDAWLKDSNGDGARWKYAEDLEENRIKNIHSALVDLVVLSQESFTL